MADNYYITINGEKICVSEEVYDVYRQMRRQERTLAEKDSRNFSSASCSYSWACSPPELGLTINNAFIKQPPCLGSFSMNPV